MNRFEAIQAGQGSAVPPVLGVGAADTRRGSPGELRPNGFLDRDLWPVRQGTGHWISLTPDGVTEDL